MKEVWEAYKHGVLATSGPNMACWCSACREILYSLLPLGWISWLFWQCHSDGGHIVIWGKFDTELRVQTLTVYDCFWAGEKKTKQISFCYFDKTSYKY